MEVKAIYRNARMSPRKIRPLGKILLGMNVADAQAQLEFVPGKAAQILKHTLKSAVANAVHNYELEVSNLLISKVLVDKGLVFKRFFPAPKGMAHEILKRNAHVVIVLGEKEASATPKKGKKAPADIATVSADTYMAQLANQEDHSHNEHEHGAKDADSKKAKQVEKKEEAVKGLQSKQAIATGKVRANQQGSDPKQGSRRQSLNKAK